MGTRACHIFRISQKIPSKTNNSDKPRPNCATFALCHNILRRSQHITISREQLSGKLQQHLVYYVSKVLTDSKCNMTEIEKIAYVVLAASGKLQHYFETHVVRVLRERSLSDLFNNPEASARIGKWSTLLSKYNIRFKSRNAIKS